MTTFKGQILTLPKMSGNVGAKTINIGGRPYEGQYEVKPTFTMQTLSTKGATLECDITVHQISINKTANNAGGNTIVIGD
jgi:hypothetical protein